jgi:hypothetical protein
MVFGVAPANRDLPATSRTWQSSLYIGALQSSASQGSNLLTTTMVPPLSPTFEK